MSQTNRLAAMMVCFVVCLVTIGEVRSQVTSSSPSQTVRGKIIKVDGFTYVVQDASGKEMKLTVDNNTMMMDGTKLKEGDMITADVTAKGQATYVIPGPPLDNQGPKGSTAPSPQADKPASQTESQGTMAK